MTAFKEAGEQKGEHIPGGYLMTIAMKFFAVYEMLGENFYSEHLNSASEEEVKEGIATLLILALEAKGYNLKDYIPQNMEVTMTLNNTVNDIYDAIEQEFYR